MVRMVVMVMIDLPSHTHHETISYMKGRNSQNNHYINPTVIEASLYNPS